MDERPIVVRQQSSGCFFCCLPLFLLFGLLGTSVLALLGLVLLH